MWRERVLSIARGGIGEQQSSYGRIIFLLRALLLAPIIFSFFLRLVMSEVYESLSR